jgi:hypothetical protein
MLVLTGQWPVSPWLPVKAMPSRWNSERFFSIAPWLFRLQVRVCAVTAVGRQSDVIGQECVSYNRQAIPNRRPSPPPTTYPTTSLTPICFAAADMC